MSLKETAPPAEAAVSLADVKRHLSIELDDTNDDELLATLLTAATELAEADHGQAYIERALELGLDAWPDELRLPSPPLKAGSVVIKYDDEAGVEQTLDPTAYTVDAASRPARVRPVEAWPATASTPGAIRVAYVAGYGTTAAAVPVRIRQAILLLVGDLYLNREDTVLNTNVARVSLTADRLLAPDRVRPEQVTV